MDPDWCLTCTDTVQHLGAGAVLGLGAQFVLPRWWQRLLAVFAIALAFEVGQADVAASLGRSGPGFGVSPKDIAATVSGAAVIELLRQVTKRH